MSPDASVGVDTVARRDVAASEDAVARPSAGGRLAWFHCFNGVAGDMVLGALVDAGADIDVVRSTLQQLGLPGWTLRVDPVVRGGIGATRAVVAVSGADTASRPYAELDALVRRADLPAPVAARSLGVLRALASAEAAVHRVPLAEVHLHELGGHDTVVDIVGSAAALHVLGIEDVVVSAIAVGTGTVHGAHGLLPNPAPAVVRLLHELPVVGIDTPLELTTPTGAALMATWASRSGPLPAMTVTASGFGAGSADPPGLTNCVQVVIGAPAGLGAGQHGPDLLDPPLEQVAVLETTVDDVTGEILGHCVAALIGAGALDAWVTPVTMKHGRPGHVITALASPASAGALRAILRRETGTLGVRGHWVQRWASPRRVDHVTVAGHQVAIKVGPHRAKAEHADVVRVARAAGLPARHVALAAETAWWEGHRGAPTDPSTPTSARMVETPPEP